MLHPQQSPSRLLVLFLVWTLAPFGHADERQNPLPDLRIATGTNGVLEAWFEDPTSRYAHFVLGGNYEPATLAVRTERGVLRTTLSADSVFEDREPRLADLDGDGNDEVIVVRSYQRGGAALAIYHVQNGQLVRLTETPDMGHPYGWLNPAGIADFDGDGQLEVLFVRKPHVMGRLEMWRLEQGAMVRVATMTDTSNHVNGSPQIRLSTVADFDGDGLPDLAIPDFDRRAIRFLRFTNGVKEFGRVKLPAPAVGDFTPQGNASPSGRSIAIPLRNGDVVRIMPPTQ
ncbi:MAG: VCBS repeat-containing protein [Pseudomonadota bacterium]